MRKKLPKGSKLSIQTATEEEIRDAFQEIKRKLKPKVCELCEITFKPRRTWQKFCSDSCRVLYFRLKHAVREAEWNEAAPILPSPPAPLDKDPEASP